MVHLQLVMPDNVVTVSLSVCVEHTIYSLPRGLGQLRLVGGQTHNMYTCVSELVIFSNCFFFLKKKIVVENNLFMG
jgi:hypothetical protein